MLQQLIQWDKSLFLFLNSHNNEFWDVVMYWTSDALTFLPLYFLFITLIYLKFQRNAILIILFLIVTLSMADLVSVHLFKNVFMRLRPCHSEDIQPFVHIVKDHCGGQYGFVSSHAANFFSVATFLIWSLRPGIYFSGFLLFWAALIGYSRIYLGVHFPTDVLGGAMVGVAVATGVWRFLIFLDSRSILKLHLKR